MKTPDTILVDGQKVPLAGERNVLEVARKAGIDIPTFCYHSELSVYGACRMCLVDIKGRGVTTSCTTVPEPGMEVKTNTAEIRQMRKVALELLLANHDQSCPTCPKSAACRLQELARRLGVDKVRFKPTHQPKPIDTSSPSLLRDPNKCILCGDCVRACREIQSVGAIDFAHRGANVMVLPAFGRDLAQVECVNCGLCASVCPTGALTPKNEEEAVWAALDNPAKTVVCQVAPAVRVALGELFGMKAGEVATGQMVAALKRLGFNQVYDTAFAADLTVLEEAEEFLARKAAGEKLPLFTSCCPAWVKFAEQYYPELLGNLSTCRSPQQMFGAVAKSLLPKTLGVERQNLVVVSVMPCTAKKGEARRPEFNRQDAEVDHVLTTQELGHMIQQAGIDLRNLSPESLDMPLGFKTGAGIIFGATGGVTEAVLRYAVEKAGGIKLDHVDFVEVRGEEGIREVEVPLAGQSLKLAIVNGLANARKVADGVRAGTCKYDLIEVMACPGGCVAGAGQPVALTCAKRRERTRGLYDVDKMLQLHKSQDNHLVAQLYRDHLGDIGGEHAHELLHTHYHSRKRLFGSSLELGGEDDAQVKVKVCVGTGCYLRGSPNLLRGILQYVEANGLQDRVNVAATFCLEHCGEGPNLAIDGDILTGCDLAKATAAIDARLGVPATVS